MKRPLESALSRTTRALLICSAVLISVLNTSISCHAATRNESDVSSGLVALAAQQFPNLTKAERAMLVFVDVKNRTQGDFAFGGSSALLDDPTNDPANADSWTHDRDVRAELIRWLCADPDASRLVDPGGIRLLGSRITGRLNLSRVHVPFPIVLRNCAIPERMTLAATHIPSLDLGGSHIRELDAPGIDVENDLKLDSGFKADGEVSLFEARIGGSLSTSGHFKSSALDLDLFDPKNLDRRAFYALQMRVGGGVIFRDVHIDGGIELSGTTIGADLILDGTFLSPGKTAIDASSTDIAGNVIIGYGVPFLSDGIVNFVTSRIGTDFFVAQATFSGAAREPHGLDASGMSVKNALVWTNVSLPNGGFLNLTGVSAEALIDDERSWPAPGNLLIDGFTYTQFSQTGPTNAPGDADTRLRWLRLQPGFHPQPYHQLAKVLRESGDQPGAIQVLIASDDASYRRSGLAGRIWGSFLNATIGYGYEPLRAIVWSFAVVVFGSLIVAVGKGAGVMRFKWPDRTPPPSGDPMVGLHPMLYSLDVFVPFVNLRQEQHWWPDETASGECTIFGLKIPVRGSVLRYYLWLQVIAGWLLSAIFVAGVTGLIHND
jgi:hypothetical protein